MSDTPLVDHIVATIHHGDKDRLLSSMSELARKLERENKTLRAGGWRCLLDGKHGSQEVWECITCERKFNGNPHDSLL